MKLTETKLAGYLTGLFVMISLQGFTQTITKWGCAEYVTPALYSNGLVYVADQSTITPVWKAYSGLSGIVDLTGAQYNVAALKSDGTVYILNNRFNQAALVGNDINSNPFNDVVKVAGIYRSWVAIRSDGTLWYWGVDNPMNYFGGGTIIAPRPLTMPVGKTIKKVYAVSNVGFSSYTKIYALTTDGLMYVYQRGTPTPTQIVVSGEFVKDFECTGFASVALVTNSNKIFTFGTVDSRYSGAVTHSSTPVDITTRWTSIGVTFPIKEMKGNFNTLHIIDANDNMFASGCNPNGEIGNGIEYTPFRTLPGANSFNFDIALNSQLLTAPVQIQGKFKNMNTDQTVTFYMYVQDLGGQWYSIGRNKSFSLSNSKSLYPYAGAAAAYGGYGSYDVYANALDIPMFKKITLPPSYSFVNFNKNDSLPPVTGAGINQYISTATTTLYGLAFQQEHQIASYLWTKVSGTGGAITTPNSATTDLTLLQTGTYVFRLRSTNTNGQFTEDDVSIFVDVPIPPIDPPTSTNNSSCNCTFINAN